VEAKYEDKPTLYFNTGREHREAYLFLLASGISCDYMAPSSEEKPTLLVGYRRYVGLKEIKRFIEEIQEEASFK